MVKLASCIILLLGVTLFSCKKEENRQSIVQFENSSLSSLEFGDTQHVGISFSSPLTSDITLTLDITDSTAVYGKDYTTSPDGSSKTISIPIPKGSTTASFDFIPIQGTSVKSGKVVKFALSGHYNNAQFGLISTLRAKIIDDASLVQFVNPILSLNEFGTAKVVTVAFSSPIQYDGNLSLTVSDSTAVYGRDYTTSPDGSSKTISIPVTKNATSASFTISPVQKSSADGDKIVNFSVTGLPKAVQFGTIVKQIATVVDDDLVCYLPMNGNAMDVSHVASSTQVQGATLTTGRKSLSNTAYQMDGISNDIIIPNSKVLDTIRRITMTAWIKPVSFYGSGNNAIVEKPYASHVNPYYQYKLGITGDQRSNLPGSFLFTLSINGNYIYVTSTSNAWTPGNWYFVAGTYDGNNMILYINGSQVANLPITGKIDSWGNDIFLGKVDNASAYTPGTFGDMRIYNRALSSTEIANLYLK